MTFLEGLHKRMVGEAGILETDDPRFYSVVLFDFHEFSSDLFCLRVSFA